VGGARAQDRGDQLPGVRVEDEERMVHLLAVVAVVSRPLLLAVRRVVGAIEIEHQPAGSTVPLPLAHIDFHEGFGKLIAGVPIHRVLQS
jgi:hypothetical protein